jgi:hypothetical protein
MTDSTKWKSVMLRVDTYDRLQQVAKRQKRALANILDELVTKEWEWNFDRQYATPNQIVKREERQTTNPGPRNPFLPRKTS